jgi:hypothetical protein
MGDNHPVLNRRRLFEKASQRLVQGCVIDQFAWPYYVSNPPSSLPSDVTTRQKSAMKEQAPARGCAICGHPEMVRSHIIPRAFAHEIRDGAPDLTVLESNADRPLFSQSGLADSALLCAPHEAITGELDRYGVDFVRRVRATRASNSSSFRIENPEPHKLLRFANSIVWRSAVSPAGNAEAWMIGRVRLDLERSIFEGASTKAQLFVGSVSVRVEDRDLLTVMMPVRSREGGAWLWRFALNGCFFALFLGTPSFRADMAAARADRVFDPVISRLDEVDALEWAGLDKVIRSIKRWPDRHH